MYSKDRCSELAADLRKRYLQVLYVSVPDYNVKW